MDREERVGGAVAAGIVVVAALARFGGLGSLPLSPAEASNAVIAWDVARGAGAPQPADPAWATASPLLASAQFLLFALLGAASEGAARAPSALAGTGLALCPWLLRRSLGIPAALVLAGMIALDPACVETSRRAEGTAIAALLGAVLLVAAQGARWAAAAVALGLLLVSGVAAWTVAPVAILASLFLGALPPGADLPRLTTLSVTAAVAGASGLLGAWSLVGGVSASLTSWLAAWSSPAIPGLRAMAPFADPLALALGGAGLLCLARQRRFAVVAACGACLWWTVRAAPLLAVLIFIGAAAPAVHEVRFRRKAWLGASLAALALVGFSLTVRIASPELDSRPPGYAGMDLLARDVERFSMERAGDAHELPVEVVCQPWPDPLLRWALRDARRLRFHSGSPDPHDRGPALVIGPEPSSTGEAPCSAPSARSGARYQSGPSRLVLWVPLER
jgi:hypothetical protein